MAARTPERRRAAAKVAAIQRHNGPDDPRLDTARLDLRALQLEEHIRTLVETAPPPTPELIARLRALLPAPTAEDGGGPRG